MELSREVMLALIALQEKDSAQDRLAAQIAKVPVDIKALRDTLAAEKARLDNVKGKIADFEKRKKECELDLAQKEEAVRKHQKELNQIKTNEAFKALQHEIDGAKAEGNEIETRILELMEQLDAARKEDKAVQVQLKTVEAQANSEIAALEARLKELEAGHAAAKSVRDAAEAALAADVIKVYMHIRTRGKLDAVVSIKDGSCGACSMRLAHSKIVDATKLKALVFCESCQRILFRPEALAAKPKAEEPVPISETAGGPLPEPTPAQAEELPDSTGRGAC